MTPRFHFALQDLHQVRVNLVHLVLAMFLLEATLVLIPHLDEQLDAALEQPQEKIQLPLLMQAQRL